MVIGAINTAYRGYKTIRRGYQTFNRYQEMYNPVVKFGTRLPPNLRKPYRTGLKIGDAILTGGIIYDVAKDLLSSPAPTIYQETNTFDKTYSGHSRRNRSRYSKSKYRCNCGRKSAYRKQRQR